MSDKAKFCVSCGARVVKTEEAEFTYKNTAKVSPLLKRKPQLFEEAWKNFVLVIVAFLYLAASLESSNFVFLKGPVEEYIQTVSMFFCMSSGWFLAALAYMACYCSVKFAVLVTLPIVLYYARYFLLLVLAGTFTKNPIYLSSFFFVGGSALIPVLTVVSVKLMRRLLKIRKIGLAFEILSATLALAWCALRNTLNYTSYYKRVKIFPRQQIEYIAVEAISIVIGLITGFIVFHYIYRRKQKRQQIESAKPVKRAGMLNLSDGAIKKIIISCASVVVFVALFFPLCQIDIGSQEFDVALGKLHVSWGIEFISKNLTTLAFILCFSILSIVAACAKRGDLAIYGFEGALFAIIIWMYEIVGPVSRMKMEASLFLIIVLCIVGMIFSVKIKSEKELDL